MKTLPTQSAHRYSTLFSGAKKFKLTALLSSGLLWAGLAIGAGTLFISGCSTLEETDFPTLANSGILPLSTNNAYVGANLFISREMERSPYLLNFLKGRGAPTAIEIIKKGNAPERVIMFYPSTRDAFAADILERVSQSGTPIRQWIIRGPYPIERNDYRSLAEMPTSLQGEPMFIFKGKPFRFRFEASQNRPTTGNLRPVVPAPITPTPTPKPKLTPRPKPTIITAPKNTPVETPAAPAQDLRRPMTSDQVALLMAQGYAERTPDGSLVHTVRVPEQTLADIAAWYTGSPTNAKALAEKNGLLEKDAIPLGKRIIVPMDLVKNFKALGGRP